MKHDFEVPARVGRRVQQNRAQKTYESLINVGFKLLQKREFEAITVADLAGAAGYSVGAFYSRFHSKDEFFEALLAHHFEERSRHRLRILGDSSRKDWIDAVIKDLVTCYWKRRRFWRAALVRSTNDPEFWKPIDKYRHVFLDFVVARVQSDAGRPLTKAQIRNVRFSSQLLLGTINNRIVNRPRPSMKDQNTFIEDLIRAFRLVSDYDKLVPTEKAVPKDR